MTQTGVDPKWRDMYHAQEEATRYVQRRVLDETFWGEVERLTVALQPLFVLLQVTDMEGSTLGLVYHLFQEMKTHVSTSTSMTQDR